MPETPPKTYWIGFDLGGTKMLCSVYDEEFQPLAQKRRKTKGQEGLDFGLERIVDTVKSAAPKKPS